LREAFAAAESAEGTYLQRRYDISNKALEALIAVGGATTNQDDFTLAMHGFGQGDLMSSEVRSVLDRYDVIQEQFGAVERLPIAEVVGSDTDRLPQRLGAIGIVAAQRRPSWEPPTSLRYRVNGNANNPHGSIEIPVNMYHQWTENSWSFKDPELTLTEDDTVIVASVKRTSSPYSRIAIAEAAEKSVHIAPHIKVGWQAIIGAYEFDKVGHAQADQLFFDRITTAREAFVRRYPAQIAAD